ncbi:bacteriohemerythrin [Telmatobacter bradus]|uniref:bacteriohemerythrin n=1 Tax=Telmatobacter bradus TaxID=474953 RepID=UPI003B438831
MTLLTWNHDRTVGVRAMDDQHGILMDAINELRLAQSHGGGREQIAEIFDRLIEFSRMHFWSEEQLMEKASYEGLNEHRALHHKMLAEMLQIAHQLQYGDGSNLEGKLGAMRGHFLRHVEEVDALYGPSLNRIEIF